MSTSPSLFMTASEVKKRFRTAGYKYTDNLVTTLAHLTTPGGGRVYPCSYIETLIRYSESITPSRVQAFNTNSRGKTAIAAAREEFEQRIAQLSALKPQGYLSVHMVATILSLGGSTIRAWNKFNKLTLVKIDGLTYFSTAQLLERCSWFPDM